MSEIDPEDQPQDPAAFGLIMPFVTVQSNGGPHEDGAYCAGWEMGYLDAILAATSEWSTTSTWTIHTENADQADLIAMKHGYWVHVDDDSTEGWLQITLAKVATDA